MSWRWDQTNALWQAAQNPLQFLDAAFAKTWYAQHSAANWQSGAALSKLTAILQDIAGGYVTTWTGAPASAAQGWWAVGLSVPSFAFSGPLRVGVSTINAWRGVSSALHASANSLLCGPQIGGYQGALQTIGLTGQMLGLGGSLAGQISSRWPVISTAFQGGQMIWQFPSQALMRTSNSLNTISQTISALRFGNRIGGAINDTLNNSPAAGLSPTVGGILFENCAATVTEIDELSGAYWDVDTGRLVLVGRDSATREEKSLPLPGLDQEHFLVALRAALAGQPLGVSIDPPAEYRDGIMSGVTPPDGTPMLVSYLGHCEETLFGAILFEADRLLKCLDKGVHNETRKPVRASVPGFRPLLEMARPSDRTENVWHRFWFVVDKVELKHDASANAVVFGDVRLKVLTETEMRGRGGPGFVDSNDGAFALHLTEFYDDYARDFPILARLKELAKITSVAKLLANRQLAIDLGPLFGIPPLPTTTPSFTPGISVTSPHVETSKEGNTIHTRTVSMFGGVDMDPEPVLLPDRSGEARALRQRAEANRPGPSSGSWTIPERDGLIRAVGISLAKPRSPFRRVFDDHEFPANDASEMLRLCRVYDSTPSGHGDFGPGWKLWTPISLRVISARSKRSEVLTQIEAQRGSPHREILLLHNRNSETTSLYRAVGSTAADGAITFARVTGQTATNGTISFRYDPADLIRKVKNGYEREENRQTYLFGTQGQLEEIQRDGRWTMRYHWRGTFPTRTEDANGNWYEFAANPLTAERISTVNASDGTMLRYIYDREGCLRACHNGRKEVETYGYDLQQRLTEVRDSFSHVVARAVYAGDDSQVASLNDFIVTEQGSKIWRTLDQGRVVQARDELGGKALFEYGPRGELSGVRVNDARGQTWHANFDGCGWLSSFENPDRQITRFEHASDGRLKRVATSRGESFSLDWDSNMRLVGWRESSEQQSLLSYNANGQLVEIAGPNARRWNFFHAGPLLLRASGPDGIVSLSPRKRILTVKSSAKGWWEKRTYDRQMRVLSLHSQGSRKTRIRYDVKNNARIIQNQAGALTHAFKTEELTLRVEF